MEQARNCPTEEKITLFVILTFKLLFYFLLEFTPSKAVKPQRHKSLLGAVELEKKNKNIATKREQSPRQ